MKRKKKDEQEMLYNDSIMQILEERLEEKFFIWFEEFGTRYMNNLTIRRRGMLGREPGSLFGWLENLTAEKTFNLEEETLEAGDQSCVKEMLLYNGKSGEISILSLGNGAFSWGSEKVQLIGFSVFYDN
jgi:hypothetical protein